MLTVRQKMFILELDLKQSKFLRQYKNRKPKKVKLCNVGEYVIETNSTYEIHLASNLQGYIMSCVDLMVWHYRSRVLLHCLDLFSRMLCLIFEFIISDIPLLE